MKKISVILFIALLCITAVCAADEISEDVIIRLREHCYVSPQGGEMLHTDQNCRIVHEKYLPLTEIEFSESLLNQYSLCPVCSASNQPEALVELSCGKVEYLNYQCTLPDGRLLLTGGTRRDEIGGDAAWIMCLNTDRTISWEYISRKDGFTAAENAVVLTDGTIAVIMEDYPKKRAAMFFSPDGKKARKQLDLKKKRGILYTITPSFMMTYEDASNKAEEYRCKTFLYDWNGKEITRYDGLIMKDGYGFIVPNDDECVFYGHDDVFNGHAMIQKLDESLDKALWETKLDWQLPGSDTSPSDSTGTLTFISLGYMYNTYQMYLYPEHPMYMFVDGEFRSLSEVAYNASIVANDASQTATENAASINTLQDQISMKVSQTTYDSDHNAIEQRLSNVEQSASDFKVEITRSVADQIAEVSGDVDGLAEEMAGFRDTVTGYMDFNGDSLAIGVVGSSFKTEITNTEMAFTENGEKVAYVSNNDMYITRARVTDTLSVGTVDNGYFDFVTLPGGLALKWRNAATS